MLNERGNYTSIHQKTIWGRNHTVLNLVDDVGCRVITVDAKQDAQSFYEYFTFETVKSKRKSDFTPMYLDVGA